MGGSRFWMAGLAAFAVALVSYYVVFGVLLSSALVADPAFRGSMAEIWPKIPPLALIYGLGFTWLYSKGIEPHRGWAGQGLRFGLTTGVMVGVAGALLLSTLVAHRGETVVIGSMVGGIAAHVAMGLAAAAILRPAAAAAPQSSTMPQP